MNPIVDHTESELILEAQAGNLCAMNELIEQHVQWARRKARVFCRRYEGVDFQDLLSAAFEAMWEAVKNYDPRHGHTLRWLAARNFRWLAIALLKTTIRHERALPRRIHMRNMDRICADEWRSVFRRVGACIDCGTYDGLIPKGKISPKRVRGRCSACHNRAIRRQDTLYRQGRRLEQRRRCCRYPVSFELSGTARFSFEGELI